MKRFITGLLFSFLLSISLVPISYAGYTQFYATQPDVSNCKEGDVTQKEKDNILKYVNQIRAVHGLKSVTYNSAYDLKAAKSALLSAANEQLNHTPPQSWSCWSQDGYDGSMHSNLFIKWASPSMTITCEESIVGWMNDEDVESCGHRRWLIDPFLKFIAFGRADASSKNAGMNVSGMSIYVISDEKQNLSDWNNDFVSYPYQNYPADLYYTDGDNHWYLSFTAIFDKVNYWNNKDVDFSSASIEIQTESNQAVQAVDINIDNDGYGVPNCIKWNPASKLVKETKYLVTIKNVKYHGTSKDFSYWFRLTDGPVGEKPQMTDLISPNDKAENVALNTNFRWNKVKDADSYSILIAKDKDFTNLIDVNSGLDTMFTSNSLQANTEYFWKVYASNSIGQADTAVVWSFTTKEAGPGAATLLDPLDNAVNIGTQTKLLWSSVPNAVAYSVQVANSNTFAESGLFVNESSIQDTFYVVKPNILFTNSTYYWRVAAKNATETGDFTSVNMFNTGENTSVENISDLDGIFIYPNPASTYITVTYSNTDAVESAISIYDINGNKLNCKVNNIDNGIAKIELNNIAAGTYTIRITSGTNSKVIPMIIVK